MKHANEPNIIPKNTCLETIEVNCTLFFANIPMDAEMKIIKPIITRVITVPRKILSILFSFEDIPMVLSKLILHQI